ncbi:hypothetical protein [Thiolapillus sp.]
MEITRLPKSLEAWGSPDFQAILKKELEALGIEGLPLQQGLSHSSIALDGNIQAVILTVTEATPHLSVKAGLFYTGIVSGCNCADDPGPVEAQNEYCEILVMLQKSSGEASIVLA